MVGRYFVSYSGADGERLALSLADQLAAGPPEIRVWVDKRELRPGEDWDEQIVEAIRTCRGLLFVMTADAVTANSVCKAEWTRALKYKKPVIPLRFDPGADLPFQLGSRQFVDFSGSFESAIARLRNHLEWLDSAEGRLQALKDQLSDAERELRRAAGEQRARVEQDIIELTRQIEEQRRLLADPQAVRQAASARIASGLEREREPEEPVAPVHRTKFVNPPPLTAPRWFQNRHVETGLVGEFLKDEGLRMMTVVGRGGVGKTAMVCRLLKSLEAGQLPDDGGPLELDGIVYLSRTGVHAVTFANVFADLCKLLPESAARRLELLYGDPHNDAETLMRALLEEFPNGRTIVLLDNFEDLLDQQSLAITDAELDSALRAMLAAPSHGVKFLLTTRIAPRELLLVQPGSQQRLELDEGLSSPYAEDVLRALDADGSLGVKHASDDLLGRARERTRGYPRALEALIGILSADRDTTLEEVLAEAGGVLPENVVDALVGEAFSRLDGRAQRVMQALAIYDRPVPEVAVDYLLQPHEPAVDSAPLLKRLVNMHFVRRDAGRYYLHQVDRDYALVRTPAGEPADRDLPEPPFSRYALRDRAADYFELIRKPREAWKTIDDLEPQLSEFELRRQGGQYDTAASILNQIAFDYLQRWGHNRLTASLYEQIIENLGNPDLAQASLGDLGNCYLSLGEFRRAIGLFEHALAIARETHDRQGEVSWLGNIGICYRRLGEFHRTVDLYEQVLGIARETGDRQSEGMCLGNLGTCYFSLGEYGRAVGLYAEALEIARETGDRQFEGNWLGSLGLCYISLGEFRGAVGLCEQALGLARETGDREVEGTWLGNLAACHISLGDVRRAIGLYEQALAIAREIEDREGESFWLDGLGDCYRHLGEFHRAIGFFQRAVEIGDQIESAQIQNAARGNLARAHLLSGDLELAVMVAQAAGQTPFPSNDAFVSLIHGIALLRSERPEQARRAFSEAVASAESQLEHAPNNFRALDAKALALYGLALLDDEPRLVDATNAFRAAREITTASGIVKDVDDLLISLAEVEPSRAFAQIREAATGKTSQPA